MTALTERPALTLEDAQAEARTTGEATLPLAHGSLLVRWNTVLLPGEYRYDWINDPRPVATTVTVRTAGLPYMRANLGSGPACYPHQVQLTEDEARKLAAGRSVWRLTVALRRAGERGARVRELIEANRLTASEPARSVSGTVGYEPQSMWRGVPKELRDMR